MKVAHEPAQHHELLGVLTTEVGAGWLHDVKELCHHRSDAAQVPGAILALQHLRDARHLHERSVAFRVHLFRRRHEDSVDALLAQEG